MKAGHAVIRIIESYGVKHGFCVPGESFLEILDGACHSKDFELIQTRHEGGASFMAEAYAKLTGKPSVLMVTRGPGACNGSIGLHTAFQDSTPMVVIIGDVARDQIGKEAFQEIDFPAMFEPVVKWAARVNDAERLPEFLHKAFHLARSGRPGPVVLSIPEDVLRDEISAMSLHGAYPEIAAAAADSKNIGRVKQMLSKAEKPLFILGGSTSYWDDNLVSAYTDFFEAHHLPYATSFRRQDLGDANSSSYVGDLGTGVNPALKEKIDEADLIIAVGTRLGEMPSQGYVLFAGKNPLQKIIFIHPDPDAAQIAFQAEQILALMPNVFLEALQYENLDVAVSVKEWTKALRTIYENWGRKASNVKTDKGLDLSSVFMRLREELPEDVILTNDAGNASGWGHRFFNYARPRRQLAPINGAMGYAVPSAIAAKLLYPDRPVVGFVGDGAFMMTGQELATAKQFGISPVIVVMNNNMYGTIRLHQEKRFPGHVSSTDLQNPDFVKLAEAYGFQGIKVKDEDHFVDSLLDALKNNVPTVIEVDVLQEQISTSMLL